MDRFQEYSDPMTREAVEYMLAHITRRPGLFLLAKQHLNRAHFDPQLEYPHGLIWQSAVELYEKYHELPSHELLGTHATTVLKTEPMVTPETEASLYDILRYMQDAFRTEAEYSDQAATDFLQAFLRERMVANRLKEMASNAFGRVPADLAKALSGMQDQLSQIDTIQEIDEQEIIPERMEIRETTYMPTGVQVFDDSMDGGSKAGEVHVVLAPTGVGKTMEAVEIIGSRGRLQLGPEDSRAGSGKLNVLFSFEGDSADESVPLASRMMCYAAEIDKSRIEHMRDYSGLSRTGNLLEYEQARFRSRVYSDGVIPGEYERLMAARGWVNKFVHLADFSMSRRAGRKPRGAGGVPEMQQYLDALTQKTKREIGTVAIDWAGQCVLRQLQMSGKKDAEKALPVALMSFVDDVRSQIASKYGCDAWVFHQLNGEANTKSPTSQLHHSMAMWCATFAVNAWFAFVMGVKDKSNNTCMFWTTKTRRGEGKDGTICLIDGAFGRLVPAHNYRIDTVTQRILTAEESQRVQLTTTPSMPPAIASLGPAGF